MPTETTKAELTKALEREVNKLLRRFNSRCRAAARDRRRYTKRTGHQAVPSPSVQPTHWSAGAHFNPIYVRPRLESIGFSVRAKIEQRQYSPLPSLRMGVPKPDGGTREVRIFSIPDAAVSYWLNQKLIERNSHFFSSYSYAYRADRNAHHAIMNLMSEIRDSSRLFVLEYDYAKYFDSIDHQYVLNVLQKHFQVSHKELAIIRTLLSNSYAQSLGDYQGGVFVQPTKGIPQGSSISLFLANVACFELDRELEREGAVFARYADDTLILCDSYEKADRCAKHLLEHGQRSGTQVNFKKSEGISLLTPDTKSEIRSKKHVVFLGHSMTPAGVTISPNSIDNMKRKIVDIIYKNLLLQPKRGVLSPARIGPGFTDWDLVQCVNEIRRYLYGRVTETQLSDALAGQRRFILMFGALSYFPGADDREGKTLRNLDGWLSDVLYRAYRRRQQLLAGLHIATTAISQTQIVDGSWYQFPAIPNETRLPSFFKAWRYVKRSVLSLGLSRFPSPVYGY